MRPRQFKYRRQYILTQEELSIDQWNHIAISHHETKYNLYSHPDLEVKEITKDNKQLILIGYVLNPLRPEETNETILENLMNEPDFYSIIRATDSFNGRFVLLYNSDKELKLFHDFTSFRQVFYHIEGKKVNCGATPNILAEYLNVKVDQESDVFKYILSDEFIGADNTLLGYDTVCENTKMLPPNFYLDLLTQKIVRFWPNEEINKLDIQTVVEECSKLLKGTVDAAVRRYPIHVGVTAGWDTRLLLSATRDFKEKIFYYVNKSAKLDHEHLDIQIPSKLANNLGFKLNIIDLPKHIPAEFKSVFYGNNFLAHDKLLSVFYEVLNREWDNTVTISGTQGNGVPRIYIRLPKDAPVDGKAIGVLSHKYKHKFIIKELDRWVNEVKELCDRCNINICDLFELEQENASWGSLASSEQDIAREEIRIFNNRQLITLFWSLNDRDRYQYDPTIYKRLISNLWGECMNVPVNPSFKIRVRNTLRFFGLEIIINDHIKRKKFFKDYNK